MPDLSDYETLSLEGVNIDECRRSFAVLTANFGEGYGAGARVGSINGLHRWTLSGSMWSDSTGPGTIDGLSWMEYYWSFFKARVTDDNSPFLLEWRGRLYFASFEETRMGVSTFTSNLFGSKGISLTQRRVPGFYDGIDGSIWVPTHYRITAYGDPITIEGDQWTFAG